MSKIEWTDETWNPTVGCSQVSTGCEHCYAIDVATRLANIPSTAEVYDGLTKKRSAGGFNWTGVVKCLPDRLLQPLKWKKPRRIFVNSMSDLFHPDVPFEFIDKVWAVMAACPQHTFQILTKRPERMKAYASSKACERMEHRPLPNVWLGVSVENQATANERIPLLLETPAAVRFLSCEPLLGAIDLDKYLYEEEKHDCETCLGNFEQVLTVPSDKINWVIVGGESGKNARPMHPDWVRSLRDQCVSVGVALFFKQWGEFRIDDYNTMDRPGKEKAGRLLDGREWNEFPEMGIECF